MKLFENLEMHFIAIVEENEKGIKEKESKLGSVGIVHLISYHN
jgi:hypothetical protein